MRLLVVGANGLLGSNVVHTAQQRGWDVRGTYHSERPAFDIRWTSTVSGTTTYSGTSLRNTSRKPSSTVRP
nr:NAD-dependent epimerase/dehydratase family protein [Halolamina pelagica]